MKMKTVYLMEGGKWSPGFEIQTAHLTRLRTKLRLYSVFFDTVIISAADYLHSNSLYQVLQQDPDLWGRKGTIKISCPDDIANIQDYGRVKFDPSRRQPYWQGRKLRSMDDVLKQGNIDNKIPMVQFTPIVTFRETELMSKLKAHAIQTALELRMSDVSDHLRNNETPYFNRDSLIEATEHLNESLKLPFRRKMLAYYYLIGASYLQAECATRTQYAQTYATMFNNSWHPTFNALLNRLRMKDRKHLRFVDSELEKVLASFGLSFALLQSTPSDKFAELCTSAEGKRFRAKLWQFTEQTLTQIDFSAQTAIELRSRFDEVFGRLVADGCASERTAKKIVGGAKKLLLWANTGRYAVALMLHLAGVQYQEILETLLGTEGGLLVYDHLLKDICLRYTCPFSTYCDRLQS